MTNESIEETVEAPVMPAVEEEVVEEEEEAKEGETE